MALGTKGFQVGKGDLVKVISGSKIAIPVGTVAPIRHIYSGNKYLLAGYEHVSVSGAQLEIVSYVRSN